MSNPFEFLNAVNGNKKNLIRDSESPEAAEKLYNGFLTARSLSYHQDCVAIVNELNMCGTANHKLSPKMHFEFLLYAVPSGRRFAKWEKAEVEQRIDLLMEYYRYSYAKAKQVVHLFADSDFEKIRASQEKGGAPNKKKK